MRRNFKVGDSVFITSQGFERYHGKKFSVEYSEDVIVKLNHSPFVVYPNEIAHACPVCQSAPVVEWLGYRTCSIWCDEAYLSIDGRFKRFHEVNPKVYAELVSLARQMKAKGARKIGIGMLFEVLRWRSVLGTEGEPFKLPNDFRSRYSRLIMAQEQDLRGIFNIKRLTS